MNNNKPTFTISNSTGKCSEEHSRRSYIPFSADKSLTSNNVIIYDCGDDREHLNITARPYIKIYNSRQKRNDRKKDYIDDYVSALEDGRACFGKGDKKEKPFHHDVIQIGNRDDLGVTDSEFDVKHWRYLKRMEKDKEASEYVQEHVNKDPKVSEAIEILKEVAEEICAGKYSNVLVHGLVIHADEPNGTPHLDFRYSIFTDNEKTGVPWRVSDHKGLSKMGFVTQTKKAEGQDATEMFTALQKFRESINSRIEEKMSEHGWERKYLNQHRKHLSTAQYEAERTLMDAERKAKEMIDEAEDLYDDYMDEIEIEKRRFNREKEEFAEMRKDLSGFLASSICEEAYRKYIENKNALEDVNNSPTRKKKHGGKRKMSSPDLQQELMKIDSKNKSASLDAGNSVELRNVNDEFHNEESSDDYDLE